MDALAGLAEEGRGAAVLFVVQRSDCRSFSPARDIDPAYAEALGKAMKAGVSASACLLNVSPDGIDFSGTIPVSI